MPGASSSAKRGGTQSEGRDWRPGEGGEATPEVRELASFLRGGELDAFRQRVGQHPANLENASLRLADLRGAPLGGANLRGAYLREADMRGLDLSDADLDGASIRDAKISGVSFPKNLRAEEIELSWRHGTRMRTRDD